MAREDRRARTLDNGLQAFQVFEWGTDRLVAAERVDEGTWELRSHFGQPFTLPSTGRYLVRVQWPQSSTGEYRFAIVER